MKKIITFCASLAFLLGISSGANALIVHDFTVTDGVSLAVPGATGTTEFPAPGAISDQLLFDLATAPAILISGTLVTPTGFLTAVTVTLHQETAASTLAMTDPPVSDGGAFTPVVAGFSTDGLVDTYSLTALLSLALPVRYFIDVTATAGSGGNYQVSLTTVLPVPIPPAAVLFLSALAGLAGFSRIRRRKAVATTT